jgi:NADPH:quinone reductase-like Zn-dependent oxidoreductase
MKEAVVTKGPKVTIKDVPIPEPGPDQVVIKVVVSGSNPKDWYVSTVLLNLNTCHDIPFMHLHNF